MWFFERQFFVYQSSGSIGSGAKTSLLPALFIELTIPLASISSMILAARLYPIRIRLCRLEIEALLVEVTICTASSKSGSSSSVT